MDISTKLTDTMIAVLSTDFIIETADDTQGMQISLQNCLAKYSFLTDAIHSIHNAIEHIIVLGARTAFYAASFPEFPGHVFVNKYSEIVVPPEVIVKKCTYPLFENLYHESLHLSLYQIAARSPFVLNKDIRVTWSWSGRQVDLEHTIHAYYVYCHIADLRSTLFKLNRNELAFNILLNAAFTPIFCLKDILDVHLNSLTITGKLLTQKATSKLMKVTPT